MPAAIPEGREVRIAFVGCGRISSHHFEALGRISGARVVAVCDILEDRAQSVGRKLGVPHFDDFAEMLRTAECDAVTIATPSGLHPEQGIMAARAGKHVITEKPMAISVEAADELVSACDVAGVRLFVVKQNRLNPSIGFLKRAVDRGRFGRIYMVNATVRWSRPQEYYDQAPWRGTRALDGGAFLNQASHYVDLVQWLAGPVESVMAYTATLARRIESEDSGVAAIRFASGALGSMEVTMLTYPKNLEGSITILGEHGSVKIGGTAVNQVEHWRFADYHDDDKLVEGASTSPPTVYGFGHEQYYRNVLAVLRGEARPDTDGREGRKSVELIQAIYRSAETGEQIHLPLAPAAGGR
jgi:UDP-N-acetyl-2-amino-2-deoxyglucuronate dehydrogenase